MRGQLHAAIALAALLLLNTGCIYKIRKAIDRQRDEARELSSAPFQMPSEFPVPNDAKAVVRPLKGSRVLYETSMSLMELSSFYDRAFIAMGLYRDDAVVSVSEQHLSVVYKGWPNGCLLTVGAVDLAYSSSRNIRAVSAELERCP